MGEASDRERLSVELKRALASVLAPRESPISFSPALLAAILAGRKTETRRPIRPAPADGRVGNPPYAAGERLWVRENWARTADGFAYQRDGRRAGGARWQPAMYMPRDAARVFLTIVRVDAARLHAIDDPSAIAEGFAPSPLGNLTARDAFLSTWDTFYGTTEFAAHANPWVWVIRFALQTSSS